MIQSHTVALGTGLFVQQLGLLVCHFFVAKLMKLLFGSLNLCV